MFEYTIAERCSLPITNSDITNDGDWVAIQDNFPGLLTSELQEKSYNSTEISQLSRSVYKFEVDCTTIKIYFYSNAKLS